MNERIRGVTQGFDDQSSSYGVFCECGRSGCIERLDVPVKVFNDVCSGERLFLVAPTHEPDTGSDVVDGNGIYRVMRAVA